MDINNFLSVPSVAGLYLPETQTSLQIIEMREFIC